jgi:predicted  nucleic acid-binding Zn-ribbon protein
MVNNKIKFSQELKEFLDSFERLENKLNWVRSDLSHLNDLQDLKEWDTMGEIKKLEQAFYDITDNIETATNLIETIKEKGE